MVSSTRVSRVAVALVVAGGAIWVVSGVLYSVQIVSCFTCRSVVVAPGVGTAGYPLAAIRSLAWDDLYATFVRRDHWTACHLIGLTAFRRGEKWAWYAMAAFVVAGVLTSLLDYVSWGGWYTFLFLGLLPLLGLALSAKTILTPLPHSGKRDQSGVT